MNNQYVQPLEDSIRCGCGGLPGDVRVVVNPDIYCDQCLSEEKLEWATKRIQGETDSFGCEYEYLCDRHFEEEQTQEEEPRIYYCDWCKQEVEKTTPMRDYEEGLNGPVYHVCKHCRQKVSAEIFPDIFK